MFGENSVSVWSQCTKPG